MEILTRRITVGALAVLAVFGLSSSRRAISAQAAPPDRMAVVVSDEPQHLQMWRAAPGGYQKVWEARPRVVDPTWDERRSEQAGGLPWFVFLEGDGKVVITSDDPDRGNIGYPGWGGSESHFRNMLQAAARHITPAEIDALVTSVKAFRTAKLTQ